MYGMKIIMALFFYTDFCEYRDVSKHDNLIENAKLYSKTNYITKLFSISKP